MPKIDSEETVPPNKRPRTSAPGPQGTTNDD